MYAQKTDFQAEIEEIHKYQWLESEKAGHDIGENRAGIEWAEKYAKYFREDWERKKN